MAYYFRFGKHAIIFIASWKLSARVVGTWHMLKIYDWYPPQENSSPVRYRPFLPLLKSFALLLGAHKFNAYCLRKALGTCIDPSYSGRYIDGQFY
jgi:hypothetical protein